MGTRLLLAGTLVLIISGLGAATSAREQSDARAPDIERYRNTVERVFMTDRGGTTPGLAACVMCHTWQTSVRFTLETPATDAGWTEAQSRKNFDVVTKLINTAAPATSRPAATRQERRAPGRSTAARRATARLCSSRSATGSRR